MAKKETQIKAAAVSNSKVNGTPVTQGKVVATIVKDGGLVADDHSPEATGIVQ